MTAAAIAAALYGAFGLEPPAGPPAPVPAWRFVTLTASRGNVVSADGVRRPEEPPRAGAQRPACRLRADRLAFGGAVTLTIPTRRIYR